MEFQMEDQLSLAPGWEMVKLFQIKSFPDIYYSMNVIRWL